MFSQIKFYTNLFSKIIQSANPSSGLKGWESTCLFKIQHGKRKLVLLGLRKVQSHLDLNGIDPSCLPDSHGSLSGALCIGGRVRHFGIG